MQKINLNGSNIGRMFEGIGALSAGGSSRLLREYPDEQRRQILDMLFKPKFGGSLQHLKIEIGGDVWSTAGSEPAVMRTKEEFIDTAANIDNPGYEPNIERFSRGYEFWLAREAKKRNTKLTLECLQWGAPEWVRNKLDYSLYTKENADMIAVFVKGAKVYCGLDFEYVGGVQNENNLDDASIPFVKMLRKSLDAYGLRHVKITCADSCFSLEPARDALFADPELWNIVHAFGCHYDATHGVNLKAVAAAGKTIWSGEHGVCGDFNIAPCGTYASALLWAKYLNRQYLDHLSTKICFWALITSYYHGSIFPKGGLMDAVEPWSGHYEIWPILWVIAHTTQFTGIGWRYIEDGSGDLDGGGSYTTIRDYASDNYSIIIETKDADKEQILAFDTSSLSQEAKKIWRTIGDDANGWFIRDNEVLLYGEKFSVTVAPGSIVTITTTSGQVKGGFSPVDSKPFPFPFHESFSDYKANQTPRYISDLYGYFETMTGDGSDDRMCLEQRALTSGVKWSAPMPARELDPLTIFGNEAWANYRASIDFRMLSNTEYIVLWGRTYGRSLDGRFNCVEPTDGFFIKIFKNGAWEIGKAICNSKDCRRDGHAPVTHSLGEGLVSTFDSSIWHTVTLEMKGHDIRGYIDRVLVCEGKDAENESYLNQGMVALGCNRALTRFDNIRVEAL